MAENQGLLSWNDVGKVADFWLAGHVLGTGGGVTISDAYPARETGVRTESGHVHQSGGASPKASSGAGRYEQRVLTFDPQLVKMTYLAIRELMHCQRYGLPQLWTPFPRIETWPITETERNNWTLAGTITGTAGARGIHVVPRINVRAADCQVVASTVPADYPGAATLTIVAGAPSAGEIQVSTSADTTVLVTNDLTAYAGGSLLAVYFGMVPVEILSVSEEVDEVNRLVHEVEFVESPPQKDYEADS